MKLGMISEEIVSSLFLLSLLQWKYLCGGGESKTDFYSKKGGESRTDFYSKNGAESDFLLFLII